MCWRGRFPLRNGDAAGWLNMKGWEQLPLPFKEPLFVARVMQKEHLLDPLGVTRQENAMGWAADQGIWWAALLRGAFDGRFLPPGYTLRTFTLVRANGRYGVCIDATAEGKPEMTCSYWDSPRLKALRGFQFLARNRMLTWKIKHR